LIKHSDHGQHESSTETILYLKYSIN